ncbi:MAG TPA: condensation domain-containing protein [Pseudonocardiaceae bacterium]|nr:condensation domain-containing protein [Pseudonocardiaceae bacterium]
MGGYAARSFRLAAIACWRRVVSSVILVPFRGPGAGEADLSWGQAEIWAAMRAQQSSLAGGSVAAFGAGQGIDYAVSLLGYFMGRYPSFRTRLRFGSDGSVRQVLVDHGEAPLRVVDAPDDADPAEFAEALRQEYVGVLFDYANEWPIRMAVVRHLGVPTHLVAVHCHLAMDGGGFQAVAADLARFDDNESPLDAVPDALDPLEQVRWQQGKAGQRQHATTVRHWRRLLDKVAADRFGHTDDERQPRHWRVSCNSPAAYLAMRSIATRTGKADTSPVLMAAVAVALADVTGVNPSVLRVMVSNRFRPGLATTVSPISQSALCVIDAAGVTVDETVERAWRGLMSAYLNAYYDPAGMAEAVADIGRERGVEIDLDCFFNDRRTEARREYSGPAPSRAELLAAQGKTTVHWGPHSDAPFTRFYVHILDAPDSIELLAFADTRYLPPGHLSAFLARFEDILVDAAFDPMAPTGIPAVTEVSSLG